MCQWSAGQDAAVIEFEQFYDKFENCDTNGQFSVMIDRLFYKSVARVYRMNQRDRRAQVRLECGLSGACVEMFAQGVSRACNQIEIPELYLGTSVLLPIT